MIKTLPYMLKELRTVAKMNKDRSSIDDDVMVNALDAEQARITDILLQNDELLFTTYYDLTATSSTERYWLPDYLPFDYDTIVNVTEVSGSDEYETVNTIWGDRLMYQSGGIYSGLEPWSVRDQYLEFPNKPSGTFRIWYTRRPKNFFYITASSGTTTTAVVGSTPTKGNITLQDDYYNGMNVALGSLVRRITDFDAYTTSSTHTITFSPALQSAVTSSTVVSIVSPLPERYHQLIIDGAARRIRTGIDEDDTQYVRMIMDSMTSMKMGIHKRVGGAEYVRKTPRM